jgi:hypothetical protein
MLGKLRDKNDEYILRALAAKYRGPASTYERSATAALHDARIFNRQIA